MLRGRARVNVIGFSATCAQTAPAFMRPICGMAICALAAIAVIAITMTTLDAPAIAGWRTCRCGWSRGSLGDRLGKSFGFFTPIASCFEDGGARFADAFRDVTTVLAAVAVRMGFFFTAIALPGLVLTV